MDHYVRRRTVIASLCLAAVAIGGVFVYEFRNAPSSGTVEVRANLEKYRYVNPLLFVSVGRETSSAYGSLRDAVASYIDDAKKEGKASAVSFYYRDMNTGRWTGVNETDAYVPGSMLKVYLLMAYLQIAESDPSVLGRKILYDSPTQYGKDFVPAHPLQKGTYYTVNDLLSHTIIESDNESAYLLLNDLSDDYKEQILKQLDLPDPLPDGTEEISPQAFSHFYRTLYNATFLSRDLSEQALKFLTQTEYKDGLVAGLPAGVEVAHKYGQFVVPAGGASPEVKELHDCGIVYHSDAPYFICVMTKGSDFGELAKVISGISGIAYGRAADLGRK